MPSSRSTASSFSPTPGLSPVSLRKKGVKPVIKAHTAAGSGRADLSSFSNPACLRIPKMQLYALTFAILWLWRYLRLMVHIVSAWTLKPIQPAPIPRFTAVDVTIILPTLGTDDNNFRRCLLSIHACRPQAVIVVTPRASIVRKVCHDLNLGHFQIVTAPRANKRLQMIQGIEHVKTSIIVFADDDVFWPSTSLTYMLAPFEDSSVGAVGPLVTLDRPKNGNVWDFLSAAYLVRWNFDVSASSHIDGGMSCLSGRTFAVRADILQSAAFTVGFAEETWFFGIPLSKADDDNYVTRWLVNHGWKIKVQTAPQAELSTVLSSHSVFVHQCIRWCRTTWRSNITSMFVDRRIWKDQPWCSYALHLSTFNPPPAILEALLAYLLHHAYDNGQPFSWFPASRSSALFLLALWILFSKTIKLWPHFYRYPADLKFLPASIAYGYAHGFIKLYSLLTLHRTTWSGDRVSLTTGFADVATSLAAGAKGSGSSILRKSGYEGGRIGRENSAKDLRRLLVRSDNSG
ncbi:MAG: hypothetical protein Q9216_005411 [Gyalolechia sp. 2 TL-2023]